MAEKISKFTWGGPRENSGGRRDGAGRPRKLTPDVVPIMDCDQWFCIQTKPKMHLQADIDVRLLGFRIFNPSILRLGKSSRRDIRGVMRPAIPDRIEPMFGRFFFVSFNATGPEWHQICRQARGVHSLLGNEQGGRPWPVPDRQIELVRGLLEPNECMYPPGYRTHRHQSEELVGTHQRLLTGVLEGNAGICEWSQAKRIGLLMRMFGRDGVPVTVTRDHTATVTEAEALAA